MDCRTVRTRLLNAEDVRREAHADLADHLFACRACGRLAADLIRAEAAYRDAPVPVGGDERFIATHLSGGRKPPEVVRAQGTYAPRSAWVRWVTAAALVLAFGLAGYWLSPTRTPQPTPSSPDVVERLIGWNLDLAEAAPADRPKLLAARSEALRDELANADLAPEERELAGQLLVNAEWLAAHDEPLDTADRFQNVADALADRLRTAEPARAEAVARQLRYVSERGIAPHAKKAGPDADAKKLEKLQHRDAERLAKLEAAMEKAELAAARKEIRRAMQAHGKGTKKKP